MYPGVSIDGSHILMETKGSPRAESCPTPHHLYMRVQRRGSPTKSRRTGGRLRRHDIGRLEGVLHRRPSQLTADDHDTSVDLYMWSEEDRLAVDAGPSRRATTATATADTCGASWTAGCERRVARSAGQEAPDYPIADRERRRLLLLAGGARRRRSGAPGRREPLPLPAKAQPNFVATLSADGTRLPDCRGSRSRRTATTRPSDHRAELTAYENAGFTGDVHLRSRDRSDHLRRPANRAAASRRPPTSQASETGCSCPTTAAPSSHTGRAGPQRHQQCLDVYEYVEGRPQLITTGTGRHIERSKASEDSSPASLMGVSAGRSQRLLRDLRHAGPPGPATASSSSSTTPAPAVASPSVPPTPPCEAADECHGAGQLAAAGRRRSAATATRVGGNGIRPTSTTKKRHENQAEEPRRNNKSHRKTPWRR